MPTTPSPRAKRLIVYVASNVRRLRLAQGLTQEDLAEYCGLDPAYIARVERGATNLTVGSLGEIADGLDVPPGRLLRPAPMHSIQRGRPKTKAKKRR